MGFDMMVGSCDGKKPRWGKVARVKGEKTGLALKAERIMGERYVCGVDHRERAPSSG